MTLNVILSFTISVVITILAGLVLIPALRKMKAKQSILEIGPNWHKTKEGTPTMGGFMFIFAIICAVLGIGFPHMLNGDLRHLLILVFALLYGAIGFVDDYVKVKRARNKGLSALQKFLLQLMLAVALILFLRFKGYLTPNLYIPFWNVTIPVWEPLYIVLAAFIIVGCVNAVNLTDGIDGLVSGVTIPVALFYVVVAFLWSLETLGIFSAALTGGLLGFLVYNFHPAKVFMGDTGSLFLGGAVCAMAFAADMPLILLPVGIVYVVETLSDIIQVIYFKLTHGKRVFKMAPIHHHFEMCGWSEVKVFIVFTTVSAIFAVISYLGVRCRFL